MENQTIYFTYQDENYTEYRHYSYAVATDKLVNSAMYRVIESLYINYVTDVITFVIGLIGNSLTIGVIAFNKSMYTVTNYYLLNLAIADLLLLITIVLTDVARLLDQFYSNFILCKGRNVAVITLISVSGLLITAFSVERYLAICKPFKLSTKSRVTKYIIGIWLLAFACGNVHASYLNYDEEDESCYFRSNDLFYLYNTFACVFFILPMTILVILYTLIGVTIVRSNRFQKNINELQGNSDGSQRAIDGSTKRTLKMLVAVVVAFFICWAPFHTGQLLFAYERFFLNLSLPYVETYVFARHVLIIFTKILFLLSTVINPIIYSIMSKNFRNAFKEVFKKCVQPKGRVHSTSATESNLTDCS